MNEQAPGASRSPPSVASRIGAAVATLAAAVVGAALARLGGVPLPWLLGSLFATALVGLIGAPIRPIRYGRTVGQVVIGSAIGVQFNKTVILTLVSLLHVMAAVALLSIVVGACGALLLMRISRIDKTTAFFATVPGGVAEMVNLAPRYGAELEPIMLAQTLRVGLIVAVAPFLVIQFAHGGAPTVAPALVMGWPIALALLAAAAIGGAAFAAFTFPNAWFMGSIAVGVAAGSFGLAEGRLPDFVLIPAQILIGASLGVQFRREFLTRLVKLMLASSLVVVFLAATMALIAAGVAVALHFPIPTMVLAFAPAGMAEMVLTAKLLGLDGTVVAGFQLVRIIVILLLAQPAYRLFARLVP
jgi:membrane AbrB-like protein